MIDEKMYAEVEFHSTPETAGKKPLNTLRLRWSTPSIDDQVSQVYLKKEGKALNSFNHANDVICHVLVLLLTILSTSLQYFETFMFALECFESKASPRTAVLTGEHF